MSPQSIKIMSSSFTRPADTTVYASGDTVANSTVAGSVVPLSFSKDVEVGSVFLRRAKIIKSGVSITNAYFRLHLFSETPTVLAGDNAVMNISGASNYVGSFDVTMSHAYADGAVGVGLPVTGGEVSLLSRKNSMYGVLEARGAYTPASGEVFTVILEGHEY